MGEKFRNLTLPEPIVEPFGYPETAWADEDLKAIAIYAEAFPGVRRPVDAWQSETANSASGDSPQHSQEGQERKTGSVPLPKLLNPEEVTGLLAEASRRSEEMGHALGVQKGMAMAQEAAQELLANERGQLQTQSAALVEGFALQQEKYFHCVEQEAVRLALAIAARILRREAQMDPLLLTGAVRVAMGQLAQSTTVRLRVPAEDEALWSEAFDHIPGLRTRPSVIGDERLKAGDCRLETDLGTADLGLRAQLIEIERGFFDRIKSEVGGPRMGGSGGAGEMAATPAASIEQGESMGVRYASEPGETGDREEGIR